MDLRQIADMIAIIICGLIAPPLIVIAYVIAIYVIKACTKREGSEDKV